MKKAAAAAVIAALAMAPALSKAEDVRVYLNGREIEFDQPPVIYNDTTFVPFRAIFEEFKMPVQWIDSEKRAVAFNNEYNISFVMDYDYIFINGLGKMIPQGPIIVNSRMLVPLRALVEGIEGDIYWSEERRSVYIESDAVSDDSDWNERILRLTNEVRAQNGLSALEQDDELSEVGYEHCADMAGRGYFGHDSPDGTTPFDRMHNKGIWPVYAGENIAAGQVTPEDVMNAWINSPEHMENILTPEFRYMGAAFYRGGDMGIYWAQEFKG